MIKKRLFGILLCLVLSMMMIACSEEDYHLWVGGVQVTSGNASNITGGETVTASYDAETKTLTLSDYAKGDGVYEWTNDDDNNCSAVIYAEDDLTIKLKGKNSAVNKSDKDYACGIYSEKKLDIKGSGVLNTVGDFGIYVNDGDVNIKKSAVNATGRKYAGICVESGDMKIDKGTVKAVGSDQEGIDVDGKFTLNDSKVKASSTGNDGFSSNNLEINSGRLDAKTTAGKDEENEYCGIRNHYDSYINGGIVNAESTGTDGIGIHEDGKLNINGGEVTAFGDKQGIKADGKLILADILAVIAGVSDTDNQPVDISDFVKKQDQKWVNIK